MKKWRKVSTRVSAMAGSLVELGEIMKAISEAIQSLRVKMEEQRKVNITCYQALMDILRTMQDLVWKSAPETRSGMESVDGNEELSELVKEKEDFQRRAMEPDKEAKDAGMVDLTLT